MNRYLCAEAMNGKYATYNRGREFMQAMRSRQLLLDGAAATELRRMGFTGNYDLLCVTHPEAVAAMHRSYLLAGADIIETNTFNAAGCPERGEEICLAAATIARREADAIAGDGGRRFVAGCVGPGDNITGPVCGLIEGGVDFLLLESIYHTRFASAVREGLAEAMRHTGITLPVVISFTVNNSTGALYDGESIESALDAYMPVAPVAVGVNCCAGPSGINGIMYRLAELIPSMPLVCYPSAGLPDASGHYPFTPEGFVAELRALLSEVNIAILGGCCGTTPAHIAALSNAECFRD